jgi:hypothetical protein
MEVEKFLNDYANSRYLVPASDKKLYPISSIPEVPMPFTGEKWEGFELDDIEKEKSDELEIMENKSRVVIDKIIKKVKTGVEKAEDFLNELFANGFVIAGGLISRIILNENYKNSDIDIFYGGNDEISDKKPEDILQEIIRKYVPDIPNYHILSRNCITFVVFQTWREDIAELTEEEVEQNPLRIQFITYKYTSLLHVLNSFDIGLSCVGWAGGDKIEMNDFAVLSYTHKATFYNPNFHNVNYPYRIAKYYKLSHRLFVYGLDSTLIEKGKTTNLGKNLKIYRHDSGKYSRLNCEVDKEDEKEIKKDQEESGLYGEWGCEKYEDDSCYHKQFVLSHGLAMKINDIIVTRGGNPPITIYKGIEIGKSIHPNYAIRLRSMADGIYSGQFDVKSIKNVVEKMTKEEFMKYVVFTDKGIKLDTKYGKELLKSKFEDILKYIKKIESEPFKLEFSGFEVIAKTKDYRQIFDEKFIKSEV